MMILNKYNLRKYTEDLFITLFQSIYKKLNIFVVLHV